MIAGAWLSSNMLQMIAKTNCVLESKKKASRADAINISGLLV